MLDRINLVVWKDIDLYDDDHSSHNVLLKCPVNGIYEGWLNETGWEATRSAEFMGPISPQPKYYYEI